MKTKPETKKDVATYGVVIALTPSPGLRHRCSPVIATREEAENWYAGVVSVTGKNEDIQEVRLCRYTVGRTQVLSTWTKPVEVTA